MHGQGDLRIEDEEVPRVGDGQVLVALGAGGVCGSDLHYYLDGGFGPVRVREPIVLGHELAGTVEAVGPGVTTTKPGDRVALNPSQPCNVCLHCREGHHQHCRDMRFLGSARTLPHTQGGFKDRMVIGSDQCARVAGNVSLAEAACAEPLAVCLHALEQAGDIRGKRVLVTGAGPIGALCVAVCAHAGAGEIVVTDLQELALSVALRMGAAKAFNIAATEGGLDRLAEHEEAFDVAFECSAADQAIRSAWRAVRPRGTVVQIGVAGNLNLPINELVAKEIRFMGTHRFHGEFAEAVALINTGAIDVKPIITQTFELGEAVAALDLASDRSKAVKVQLRFDGTQPAI